MQIERGTRLPSKEALRLILGSLTGQLSFDDDCGNLLRLYIRATFDGDPLFDWILDPRHQARRSSPAKLEGGDSDRLIARVAKDKAKSVPRGSNAQFEAATSTTAAFWVWEWLLQSGRKSKPSDVAEILGLPLAEVTTAIDALVSVRLLKRGKDGRFFSPYFESDIFNTNSQLTNAKKLWIARQIQDRMAREPVTNLYPYLLLAVPDEQAFGEIAAFLREAIKKSHLLRSKEPLKNGFFVAVEARGTLLFRF